MPARPDGFRPARWCAPATAAALALAAAAQAAPPATLVQRPTIALISEADKATARALRQAHLAPAVIAKASPAPASASAPPAAAPTPPGTAFALASGVLRTRAEALQMQAAMAPLLGTGTALRTEILPAGDDWRVASWPFAQGAEAERARARLAARGLRVSVLAF